MSVDSRLLIKQIEARPALWNRDDKDYCHKQIISRLWTEIAVIHGVHESKVKRRWKALRDTFRQELKKNPHHSPWGYYLDMQFLKGQLKTLPSPAPNKSTCDEDSGDVTFIKTEHAEEEDATRRNDGGTDGGEVDEQEAASAPEEPDSSRDCCRTSDNDNDDDDDLHFLLSLLPQMRRLHPRQKLHLRIKMMELVYKEAYHQQKF